MASSGASALTPRQRIEAECARSGRRVVAEGCIKLLRGEPVADELVLVVGGEGANALLDGRGRTDWSYWLRVWGARGLLWNWDASATEPLRVALRDDTWRVREMACKVVARHLLGDLIETVATLHDDPVPRVRRASARALVLVTAGDG